MLECRCLAENNLENFDNDIFDRDILKTRRNAFDEEQIERERKQNVNANRT